MFDSSMILPAFVVLTVLCGMHARIDVYGAFVRGAKEGLATLLQMLPYLCAMLTATALLRETGVLLRMETWLAPVLSALGLPGEIAPVALLRPLSGSAALAAVRDVLKTMGADSRAGRIACVISGASETVFFTGALYLGAAGLKRSGYAIPVAMIAYAVGMLAAGWMISP
ncbi:MAG: spore maturation protein [Clostridia bacterium]|nr:spore maturation protein [Clostridia bacterium]